MASKIFGPSKCRVRVITAAPAPARLRPRPWPCLHPAEGQRAEVEPDAPVGYDQWLALRKRQRADLEAAADLKSWINSKIWATDLELRVLETLESRERRVRTPPAKPEPEVSTSQQQKTSSKFYGITPKINLPSLEPIKLLQEYLDKKRLRFVDFFQSSDRGKKGKLSKDDLMVVFEKANLPITDLQMDELTVALGDQAKYLHFKVLAQALNTWKDELRQEERKVGGLPEIVLSPNKAASVEAVTVQGHRVVCKRSCYLKVPAVNLSESRPFTAEELEQLEMRDQDMTRTLKSKMHHMDLMEKCLLVRAEKRSMACHSLPTTMGGEMGEAANAYRQRCLTEYKKILMMCQHYGISFTERMLEKALLHPGDKLTVEPGQSLKLRQPGTGVLSDNDVEQWLSSRQRIAVDQLNRELLPGKGDVQMKLALDNGSPKQASEEPETKLRQLIAVDQLNHELLPGKGEVQMKLALDNGSPKQASEEPETKLRQRIEVDQLNRELLPGKGDVQMKLALDNGSPKQASEEPETKLRQRIKVDQLNRELLPGKGDVQMKLALDNGSPKQASEVPETKLRQRIKVDQLNRELLPGKGDVQMKLALDNGSPKQASEVPETKLRQLIAVDQVNHELLPRKGDVQMKLALDNGSPKQASEEPETKLRLSRTSPRQSRRKSHGKEKDGGVLSSSSKKLHMTLDDYMKCRRKLKGKLQSVPGSSPQIQANPRAFWPGHMLDKVRMYLPYAKLEHEEVLFSNTRQVPRLSPSIYHNEKSWPVSDQGYLIYGDIEMRRRYML
ncbi:uncharacterized protein si:dkey-197j19.5 [Heptranchias perlo]|uniref:uncharacterized protein si:dkey-197j19.5 n=1 Tax=Heptranchias perlo TaxID=212740 RepID=UPI00355A9C67